MKERIQKILSSMGVASRRKAEELIEQGEVLVNGKQAKLGDKADARVDEIVVKGKKIKAGGAVSKKVYYALNKPEGVVCSLSDRHADRLVTDLVPVQPKVWPVGRLDKKSSGLIILTNDGELTHQLTHPSFQHEKEYEVEVNQLLTKDFLQIMKKGIKLEEGIAVADEIEKIGSKKFRIILHQGYNRQIRRMCEKKGFKVLQLKRIRIGKQKLGNLKDGEYKKIKNIF